MNFTSTKVGYRNTGYFSNLILDYLDEAKELKPFYAHPVSVEGIKTAIEERKSFNTNRQLLIEVLQKHYSKQALTEQQETNIKLLKDNNCFTITTAHQPNIFSGHLYFIYKILHVIKLCEQLKQQIPENNFVPVFYMGSEDADLDELGHVYINSNKIVWNTNQNGAVGRMKVDKNLVQLISTIEGELAVEPYGKGIVQLMRNCYTESKTIEEATFKLVNELFGNFGIIVLLPDDADYKRTFSSVIEKELFEEFSHKIVEQTAQALSEKYKVQAAGRELNLFYLKDDIRERIVKENNTFKIQNTNIVFDKESILLELTRYPERFSPNVILRPVFQEMILPNICFIGGGGELAYWLELKNVFAEAKVPYPVLVLRNSFLIIEKKQYEKLNSIGMAVTDSFKSEQELINILVQRDSKVQLSLEVQKHTVKEFYATLKNIVGAVDVSLQQHTESLEKQAQKKIGALEKKMLRAEKKKFEAQKRQISKLKNKLFPYGNLQERIENFMPFYARHGQGFINVLYNNSEGLEQHFCILEVS